MNWAKMDKRPAIENTGADQPPCKDCKSRIVGCHSKCMKYMSWQLEREAYREERLKEKLHNNDIYSFRDSSNIKRRNDSHRNSKKRD